MYVLVLMLKAVNEVALVALISQGALFILAGSKRDNNFVYFILKSITMPVMKFARQVTPRFVLDQHIGFVALSQVVAQGQIKAGSGWIVPETLHDPIRQDAVLLSRGKDNPAALALMRFLRSDTARQLIAEHG